jgi:hypothetical protein
MRLPSVGLGGIGAEPIAKVRGVLNGNVFSLNKFMS